MYNAKVSPEEGEVEGMLQLWRLSGCVVV